MNRFLNGWITDCASCDGCRPRFEARAEVRSQRPLICDLRDWRDLALATRREHLALKGRLRARQTAYRAQFAASGFRLLTRCVWIFRRGLSGFDSQIVWDVCMSPLWYDRAFALVTAESV